jgi:hypothetical protein
MIADERRITAAVLADLNARCKSQKPVSWWFSWWSRLGSNQRPSACEADALPLSHGTRRATSMRNPNGPNDVED